MDRVASSRTLRVLRETSVEVARAAWFAQEVVCSIGDRSLLSALLPNLEGALLDLDW